LSDVTAPFWFRDVEVRRFEERLHPDNLFSGWELFAAEPAIDGLGVCTQNLCGFRLAAAFLVAPGFQGIDQFRSLRAKFLCCL
jgi:hypothetical protein